MAKPVTYSPAKVNRQISGILHELGRLVPRVSAGSADDWRYLEDILEHQRRMLKDYNDNAHARLSK